MLPAAGDGAAVSPAQQHMEPGRRAGARRPCPHPPLPPGRRHPPAGGSLRVHTNGPASPAAGNASPNPGGRTGPSRSPPLRGHEGPRVAADSGPAAAAPLNVSGPAAPPGGRRLPRCRAPRLRRARHCAAVRAPRSFVCAPPAAADRAGGGARAPPGPAG